MVLLNLIGIAILKICSFKGTNDQLSAFILLQFGGRYLILARNALKSWLDWWKVWILIPYLEFRILKIRVHRKSCRAVRFVNSGSGNNHHHWIADSLYFLNAMRFNVCMHDSYSHGFSWSFNFGLGCGVWHRNCSADESSWVRLVYLFGPFAIVSSLLHLKYTFWIFI